MPAIAADLRSDPFAPVLGAERGRTRPVANPATGEVLAALDRGDVAAARRVVARHNIADERALLPLAESVATEALEDRYGEHVRHMLARAGVLPGTAAHVTCTTDDELVHIWPHGLTPPSDYFHQHPGTTVCGRSPSESGHSRAARGAWQTLDPRRYGDTYARCPQCEPAADQYPGTDESWAVPVFDSEHFALARREVADRLIDGVPRGERRMATKKRTRDYCAGAIDRIFTGAAMWAATGDHNAWARMFRLDGNFNYGLTSVHVEGDMPAGVQGSNSLVPVEEWRKAFGAVPMTKQLNLNADERNEFQRSIYRATLEAAHGRPWTEHIGVVFSR